MSRFSPRCAWRSFWALGLQDTVSLHFRQEGEAILKAPGIEHPVTVGRNRGDRGAFDQVLIQRNYDHPYLRRLESPRLIIDAGAHIGMASVFFANLFPQAKVIALEPDERNFELLQRNTAAYKNVSPFQAAAWWRFASLRVTPNGDSWANSVTEDLQGSIWGVPLFFIAPEVDILKIDIEGSEKQIFEAGALPRCKLLLIETHDYLQDGCSKAVGSWAAMRPFTRARSSDVEVYAFN